MYQFACDFLGTASPKRPLCELKVVPEDGFFYQDLVGKLGFTNAVYMTDKWHLVDSGIENIFGRASNALLRGHMVKLVKAEPEAEFDSTIQCAMGILQNQVP